MRDYEKLGVFYLGKAYDTSSAKIRDELILYDSKDLTTHAVIIGMTGSGKTGLGITIIEEALIDNIPVIAIDPKGDLPNLLLTFPDLAASSFRPWINEQEALKEGLTPEQFAARQAEKWNKGLESWAQGADRIARLKAAADFAVYTPGSSAGLPVSVLRSFDPPPSSVQGDRDLLRDKIQTTTTALLALLGVDADPMSREHVLISNIFSASWSAGKSLNLEGLIRAIQEPPFDRMGVLDLESTYPSKERFALAMRLNNLLAAPGFEAWLQGEPMDISRMLYTPQGKPKASVFTISHLSDEERMFFVSMLLNEVLGWIRTQSGTTSLRAILYMDEIFGFFPPVQNPPSKKPLLTLLKQARAFGLGVVLSTQNPVDLDYKGLSNAGTWFIGRLQTERDKERVLSGLEGASGSAPLDRARMSEILSGLGQRVFLLHNVHENEPVLFQTRWTLSYLAGPLSRDQIKRLMDSREPVPEPAGSPEPKVLSQALEKELAPPRAMTGPPVLLPEIKAFFLAPSGPGKDMLYYPAILGRAEIHYSAIAQQMDARDTVTLVSQLEEGPLPLDWDRAIQIRCVPSDLETSPVPGNEYAELPQAAMRPDSYKGWGMDLLRWLRQNRPLVLYRSKRLNMTSLSGESEADFRARLGQKIREKRDFEVEKLRKKYSPKFTALKNRLLVADQAVGREQDQVKSKQVETVISFGTAILGAFLGRKVVSATSAGRMGTAMKTASRMGKEKSDVARAQERVEAVKEEIENLEKQFQEEVAAFESSLDPSTEELEEMRIAPKSTDVALELLGLVWMPYRKESTGRLTPNWRV